MFLPFLMIVTVYTPDVSRDTFKLLFTFLDCNTSLPEKSYTFINAPVRSSSLRNFNSLSTGFGYNCKPKHLLSVPVVVSPVQRHIP